MDSTIWKIMMKTLNKLLKIVEENEDPLTVPVLYNSIRSMYEDEIITSEDVNQRDAHCYIEFEGDCAVVMDLAAPTDSGDTLDIAILAIFGLRVGNDNDFTMSRNFSFEPNSINAYRATQVIRKAIQDSFIALKGFKEIIDYSKQQKHKVIIKNLSNFIRFDRITIAYQKSKFVAYYNHDEIASNKSAIECYKQAYENRIPATAYESRISVLEGKTNADIAEEAINSVLRHFGKATIPNAKKGELFNDFKYEGLSFIITIGHAARRLQVVCSDNKQTNAGTLIQISDFDIKKYLTQDNDEEQDEIDGSNVYKLFTFKIGRAHV